MSCEIDFCIMQKNPRILFVAVGICWGLGIAAKYKCNKALIILLSGSYLLISTDWLYELLVLLAQLGADKNIH